MKTYKVNLSVSGWHSMLVQADSIDDILDDDIAEKFDPSTIDMLQFDLDIDSIEEVENEHSQ